VEASGLNIRVGRGRPLVFGKNVKDNTTALNFVGVPNLGQQAMGFWQGRHALRF